VTIDNIGHCWIWSPPQSWTQIKTFNERVSHVAAVDWPRLGIYVGLTAATSLFLAFAFARRKLT
jgi:hypothetical protein